MYLPLGMNFSVVGRTVHWLRLNVLSSVKVVALDWRRANATCRCFALVSDTGTPQSLLASRSTRLNAVLYP
jgi:hypothetical protein